MLDQRGHDERRRAGEPSRRGAPPSCERCGGRLAVYQPGAALYTCLACLDCGGVAFVPPDEHRGSSRGPSAPQPATH